MTMRSATDDNEIPAQPAVRSAWDAVKSEVTGMAIWGTTTALNVALVAMNAAQGHTGLTALWAVVGTLNASQVAFRAVRAVSKLKDIPAPKP